MDIVIDILSGLSVFMDMIIDFIAPYFLEIVIGFIMATFTFGLIQSHR